MTDKRRRKRRRTHNPLEGRLALSPAEFCAAANLSLTMLYKLWREGKGPPYKKLLNKKRLIEIGDGRRWLQGRDGTSDSPAIEESDPTL
jgi:hypothetical protein